MDLARLSLRMAFSGFGYGEQSDASNLLPLFDRLGIRYDENTVHYEVPGPDTIGYAYGVREISEDSVLVVVVVRGGNYKKEWAGNFTLGNTEDHQGFLGGADKRGKGSDCMLQIQEAIQVFVVRSLGWSVNFGRAA